MKRGGERVSPWRTIFATLVIVLAYAAVALPTYLIIGGWLGLAIGLACPWILVGIVVGIAATLDYLHRRTRRELGSLSLDGDRAARTIRYRWSGNPDTRPAAAIAWLTGTIDYYQGGAALEAFLSHARDMATERLADQLNPSDWTVIQGEAETERAAIYKSIFGYSTGYAFSMGSGAPRISAREELEIQLAFLHDALTSPRGADVASFVLSLTAPKHRLARLGRRSRRAIRQLVAAPRVAPIQ